MKTLHLDEGEWIVLADTLADIICNNGELDCDLKDYLELEDNPFKNLYNKLMEV